MGGVCGRQSVCPVGRLESTRSAGMDNDFGGTAGNGIETPFAPVVKPVLGVIVRHAMGHYLRDASRILVVLFGNWSIGVAVVIA